jgi:indole-3-glycerol phosphate synthase
VSLLADILATKRVEIADLRTKPRAVSRAPSSEGTAIDHGVTRAALSVVDALRRGPGAGLRIIAEVKLRSPSAGALSRVLTPGARAVAYAEAGAAMVSVLCDERYFGGSWSDLAACRAQLDAAGRAIPLLAKDYVLDERQIEEARDRGADAVLLIARIVSRARLVDLAHAARVRGIEPLVEVLDEGELESAIEARARVIGVNARDLDTLQMDAARAARVLAAIPPGVVAVHLSGLRSGADVALLARERADAALVGEALMRQDDPRPLLTAMVRDAG